MAHRVDGAWSVAAATRLRGHDPSLGLALMGWILAHGSLEARRAMVGQTWNFTRSPHAFIADGIHEARCWVEQKLREVSSSGPAKLP